MVIFKVIFIHFLVEKCPDLQDIDESWTKRDDIPGKSV